MSAHPADELRRRFPCLAANLEDAVRHSLSLEEVRRLRRGLVAVMNRARRRFNRDPRHPKWEFRLERELRYLRAVWPVLAESLGEALRTARTPGEFQRLRYGAASLIMYANYRHP